MTKIEWDSIGQRTYEIGIDRGVLYIEDTPPTPWYGLLSVSNAFDGGEIESNFIDGRIFTNSIAKQEYKTTIKAINIPDEFNKCFGINTIEYYGVSGSNQKTATFNLSYRTLIRNDISVENKGYKIHLIYNAIASKNDSEFNSLAKTIGKNENSISIFNKPSLVNNVVTLPYRVIDSTKYSPEIISTLEDILYGTDILMPRFPSMNELDLLLGG